MKGVRALNSRERLVAALQHREPDRVPVNITYFVPAFHKAHFGSAPGQETWEAHLEAQIQLGFDPLIGVGGLSGQLWQLQPTAKWIPRERVLEEHGDAQLTEYAVDTPTGTLTTVFRTEEGQGGWQVEPLIKRESDLQLLEYLPGPDVDDKRIDHNLRKLGSRGLGFVGVNGIWQQTCYVRGMSQMAMDLHERPGWAKRFLARLGERLAEEAAALCRTDAEVVFVNESYLGMGMSPATFEEFVRPIDQRLVETIKGAGRWALLHDCGRCNDLLEPFADMGIDYLETLTPRAASGDIEPGDVKRRIGDQVCLRGGFNHHIMSSGTPSDVEAEVRMCLDTMAPEGGYMLCPAGPILSETPLENLIVFAQAARQAA